MFFADVWGQIVPCTFHILPKAQILICFAVWSAIFELRANIETNAPNDPINYLDMVETKSTLQNLDHVQMFVCFIIWWAVVELWMKFEEHAVNNPEMTWHVQS